MGEIDGIPIWRSMGAAPVRSPHDKPSVVVVGGGPVGLAMALDLGRRGHDVVLLNKLDFIAAGSKAICFSKRSLEIFDRLGVGDAMVEKGIVWETGKVFRGDRVEPVYQFDLLQVKDQKRPAFINIQQYHVEERLIAELVQLANVELRWGHEAVAVRREAGHVTVGARAGDTDYEIEASYVVACDGSRSAIRDMLGLDFDGRVFEDNFLIADVKMASERPSERWFWFEPPFNGARSALLHKQPDNVWRLDFQLGCDIDRDACVRPENVEPYVRAMLGPSVAFEKEWYSVYTFQCRRMARFVHDRVLFAGDSAHLVSPFGARGCNGGLADVANLGWKLDLVLRGEADAQLLESYDCEAIVAADENILCSTRSTDFIAPGDGPGRAFRDAVLDLAAEHEFARPFVNSGRLSTAVSYAESPLNTPDVDRWHGGIKPGSVAIDARFDDGWLLDRLGNGFALLALDWRHRPHPDIPIIDVANAPAQHGPLIERYALMPGAAYLIRPDHYVAARWKEATLDGLEAAASRARAQ